MASFGLDPLAIEAAEQRERFADVELFGEPRLLQRDADPLADLIVLLAPAKAEDLHLAGSGVEQAFEDFDRGGFARAVGTQQAKALALFDCQVETAHRIDRRFAVVALHKLGAANGKHQFDFNLRLGYDGAVPV